MTCKDIAETTIPALRKVGSKFCMSSQYGIQSRSLCLDQDLELIGPRTGWLKCNSVYSQHCSWLNSRVTALQSHETRFRSFKRASLLINVRCCCIWRSFEDQSLALSFISGCGCTIWPSLDVNQRVWRCLNRKPLSILSWPSCIPTSECLVPRYSRLQEDLLRRNRTTTSWWWINTHFFCLHAVY